MKKLRIAVWYNLPSGGAKCALWDHVSGLIQRGHYLESWCPETADKSYLSLGKLCGNHVLPLARAPYKKMPKFFGFVADYRCIQARIAAMHAHCAACAAEINQGDFDILLASSCADLLASPIARYLNLPKVIYLQEPNRGFYEALEESPWAAPPGDSSVARLTKDSIKRQHWRVLMREELDNAARYDRILANSFYSRECILRAYGLESEVCYLGIDTDFFHPTNEPVEKYVIGLGQLLKHKGAKLAIQSLALVPVAQRPKLLWIGNANGNVSATELADLAKKSGVEFELKIMVKDAELISYLSRATAMIYPSRLEPFGLAPLEANACGTPVIGLAEGGVRETVVQGENGLLVPNARPETIAAAIQKIISDPELAAQLRRQCRSTVLARWKTSAAAERLETALLDTLASLTANKTK
jgi:glycosyltransferase involved in cell wall biosynthesis